VKPTRTRAGARVLNSSLSLRKESTRVAFLPCRRWPTWVKSAGHCQSQTAYFNRLLAKQHQRG
jgi:hypothetical protein